MYSEILVEQNRGGNELIFIIMKFSYSKAYQKFQNDSYLHVKN
jgi:hypothetical protein